ncbi:MAG: hypothetical protein U9N33_09920, partial [Campylobacterota bacterium]|nr:hypothetical protein [Campylobacterota bacterium]
TTRVQEGMKNGASAEAIVNAMSAETPEEASKIIMAHKESGGHTNQNDEHKPEKSAVLAYAEQNIGSIK